MVLRQVDGSGARAEFISKTGAVVPDAPLVVWVDGISASASEVRCVSSSTNRRPSEAIGESRSKKTTHLRYHSSLADHKHVANENPSPSRVAILE